MASFRVKNFNRCDFFLLIWVLYYLQGIAYPEGGIISLALLGVNLLISASCSFKVMQRSNKPIYFKGLNILLILFTIYGFVLVLLSPYTLYYPISGMSMKSYNYIKSIYHLNHSLLFLYYITTLPIIYKKFIIITIIINFML